MNKKELYYELTKKHFDLGILKEVYSSENVSVTNLADSYYLAVPFAAIEKNIPVGVITDANGLKRIIEDNNHVYVLGDYYAKTKQDKYIVSINDDLIRVFLPIKQKREETASVSGCIDLNFEQELMAKNKNR